MGDPYDEDEGRLMIDDAILDSTHSSQSTTGNGSETTSKTTRFEKTVELTPTSEDGVESHPVDPEPKPNFLCESGVSKIVQSAHRDERLKMTIRRTQSPVGNGGQFAYLGENQGDGTIRSDDMSKEEGEIDDEEESSSNVQAQAVVKTVHHSKNWSGYQNLAFEAASVGTRKFRHSGQQQPFEHHALYSTAHSAGRQLAVNISLSSTVNSPGQPNVTGSVTVEEHNARAHAASSYPSKTQSPPKNPRLGIIENQTLLTETQFGDGSANLGRQNAVVGDDGLENTGIPGTLSSKTRKKKRRVSERDEREACGEASSSTSFFNMASSQFNIASLGSIPGKRKQNVRDRATCVSVKSVQTNESDIDVKIGSSHCLNISILAKASNYLYFVTNWNGHDLYGVLGDGLPPLQNTYMSKKNCSTSVSSNNALGYDLFNPQDKTIGNSPSKQRPNMKRTNRSSSVCPPNGFPETKPSGRKNIVANVGRPSSASTSDVQSVGGELQDEERSQSPVSWFTSGSSDPVSALGSLGTGTICGLSQLRECNSSAMYSCPVAGCEHRYDMQPQLAIHYHTHFVKEDGGKAIYVENMGTQTNLMVMKDAAVDPFKEQTQVHGSASEEIAVEVKNAKRDVNISHLSPKPKFSKALTNHEEQSINELFKVVTQKVEADGSFLKTDNKKIFPAKGSKINADTNNAYGTLPSDGDIRNLKAAPTALDAIRKMVTNSGNVTSSSQQSVVISSAGPLLSTSIASSTVCGGATSPAFSDISDDAPTLEKEVTDKSEDRSLDRLKELVKSTDKSTLGNLSLSMENEKVSSLAKSSIRSSNLLCHVNETTTTTITTLAAPRLSTDTNQSSTSDGSKKSDTKSRTQTNIIGSFGSSFMDPSSFSGSRHPSTLPISMSNFSHAPTASVFAQPYFMPFISSSNNPAAGMSQPPILKHKIHDLKANPQNLIASQTKESVNIGQPSAVVASPNSRPLSQGGPSNIPAAKQAVHQQTAIASGSSFTGLQPHPSIGNDRNAGTQNAHSSTLNFVQQQQQQAYFAQLQQHHQMQYMQRFGAFPMTAPPNSMNAVAQQAYEQQMAALHASFGFPGIFMPPSFPPK